jgi:transposase-like protein
MSITCPNCSSALTHRSNKSGFRESVLMAMVFIQPFRCEECDSRFYRWSIREKPGLERPAKTS